MAEPIGRDRTKFYDRETGKEMPGPLDQTVQAGRWTAGLLGQMLAAQQAEQARAEAERKARYEADEAARRHAMGLAPEDNIPFPGGAPSSTGGLSGRDRWGGTPSPADFDGLSENRSEPLVSEEAARQALRGDMMGAAPTERPPTDAADRGIPTAPRLPAVNAYDDMGSYKSPSQHPGSDAGDSEEYPGDRGATSPLRWAPEKDSNPGPLQAEIDAGGGPSVRPPTTPGGMPLPTGRAPAAGEAGGPAIDPITGKPFRSVEDVYTHDLWPMIERALMPQRPNMAGLPTGGSTDSHLPLVGLATRKLLAAKPGLLRRR